MRRTFGPEPIVQPSGVRRSAVVLLRRHRGQVPTSLIFRGPSERRWVVRNDASLAVTPSAELLAELREVIGEEAVLIERG